METEPFREIVTCPGCTESGVLVWLSGKLLRASGFHQEKGRFDATDPTIVCDHCDCIIVAKPRD